ncbi:sensor domain-containing diguanylate cyclase [Calidithermus roseus]|uniref:Putative signaling protein n=1 Tax=Calidithermus roseus TaxID=1644118 RepID=A0A399EZW4_9DEIN|nr:GGDEF domain-containing protein [Calidithermus roseus]RIH88946.1 putative signaling protein [Calidithermus roseus]
MRSQAFQGWLNGVWARVVLAVGLLCLAAIGGARISLGELLVMLPIAFAQQWINYLYYRRNGVFLDDFVFFVDLVLLAWVLRLAGGSESPLVFIVYIWLYSAILAGNDRGVRRWEVVPYLGAMAVLGVVGYGHPGYFPYLLAHAVGLTMFALNTRGLHAERYIGERDPLTGALNRRSGLTRLDEWIRGNKPFVLAFVDLKNFKTINDTYGHTVGDEVLKGVADRLKAAVRREDLVLRYGGDEFVVASASPDLLERLMEAFDDPFQTSVGPVEVQGDVGCVQPRRGESLEALLVKSDAAMYRMKYTGNLDIRGENVN